MSKESSSQGRPSAAVEAGMAHLQNPAVLAVLPDSALAHRDLIADHVGADRPLGGLSNRGLMWVQ